MPTAKVSETLELVGGGSVVVVGLRLGSLRRLFEKLQNQDLKIDRDTIDKIIEIVFESDSTKRLQMLRDQTAVLIGELLKIPLRSFAATEEFVKEVVLADDIETVVDNLQLVDAMRIVHKAVELSNPAMLPEVGVAFFTALGEMVNKARAAMPAKATA